MFMLYESQVLIQPQVSISSPHWMPMDDSENLPFVWSLKGTLIWTDSMNNVVAVSTYSRSTWGRCEN